MAEMLGDLELPVEAICSLCGTVVWPVFNPKNLVCWRQDCRSNEHEFRKHQDMSKNSPAGRMTNIRTF